MNFINKIEKLISFQQMLWPDNHLSILEEKVNFIDTKFLFCDILQIS